MPDNTAQPLVSVVIPTWNAADYLPTTLETVFNQTWPSVQIVVVDDGSTDQTTKLLAGYGDRLTTVRLENSGGPSRPRNQGIEHSRGEFIAFFDSDDLMEPEKLSRAMAVLLQRPDVGLVSTNFRSIDPQGQVLKDNYLAEYQSFRKDLSRTSWPDVGFLPTEIAFHHLLRINFVGTSSVVCRRELLSLAGPFDEEMKNADDIDMWRRLARQGCNFAFIDQVLHSYRVTPSGVTARGVRRIPAMIKGLENQLPHCRREEDRRFILEKIRLLHLTKAWELRRQGEMSAARTGYRTALAMRWGWRPFAGWLHTFFPFARHR